MVECRKRLSAKWLSMLNRYREWLAKRRNKQLWASLPEELATLSRGATQAAHSMDRLCKEFGEFIAVVEDIKRRKQQEGE